MSQNVWCNGRILAADELRISPFDRGLTVGLGLFETLLGYAGEPVFLARHLARHGDGCQRLGWPPPVADEWRQGIRDVLAANDLTQGEVRLRVFQTAGAGDLAEPAIGPDHRLLITASPLPRRPERIALMRSPWVRNEKSPLVGLKCASYAENLLALSAARAAGFDEPLFLNTTGEVCETATANLFALIGGRLVTPPLASGCLPGITRGWLLEIAPALGVAVEERALSWPDLEQAEGLFMTSATRGLVPVSRLGERHWGDPGELFRFLGDQWFAATRKGLSP